MLAISTSLYSAFAWINPLPTFIKNVTGKFNLSHIEIGVVTMGYREKTLWNYGPDMTDPW